jgi:hypothetical protein
MNDLSSGLKSDLQSRWSDNPDSNLMFGLIQSHQGVELQRALDYFAKVDSKLPKDF